METQYQHCLLLTAEDFSPEQLQETYYSLRANLQITVLLATDLNISEAYAELRKVAGSDELTALRLAQDITFSVPVSVNDVTCQNLHEVLAALPEEPSVGMNVLLAEGLSAEETEQTKKEFAQQMLLLRLPVRLLSQDEPKLLAGQKQVKAESETFIQSAEAEKQSLQSLQTALQTKAGKKYVAELLLELQTAVNEISTADRLLQVAVTGNDADKVQNLAALLQMSTNANVQVLQTEEEVPSADVVLFVQTGTETANLARIQQSCREQAKRFIVIADYELTEETDLPPDNGEIAQMTEMLSQKLADKVLILPMAIDFCTLVQHLQEKQGLDADVELLPSVLSAGAETDAEEIEAWTAGKIAEHLAKVYEVTPTWQNLCRCTGLSMLSSWLQTEAMHLSAEQARALLRHLQHLQGEIVPSQTQEDTLQSRQTELEQQLAEAQTEQQHYREQVKTACRQAKAELSLDSIKAKILDCWLSLTAAIPKFKEEILEKMSADDDVYELTCISIDVLGTEQNEIWAKIRNDVQIFDAYYQHCKEVLQSLYAEVNPQLEVPNLKLFKPQLQPQTRSAEDWYKDLQARLDAVGARRALSAKFLQDDNKHYENEILLSPLVWNEKSEKILQEAIFLMLHANWMMLVNQLMPPCKNVHIAAKELITALQKSCQQVLQAKIAKSEELRQEIELLQADRVKWQEFQQEQSDFNMAMAEFLRKE